MIDYLDINNYKSIKKLGMECSRINVLIGEPNVGKSNILEALDLSYLSSMLSMNNSNRKAAKDLIDIKKYFRVNNVADLYNDGDISKPIKINHPGFSYDTELIYKRENSLSSGLKQQNGFFEITTGSTFTDFDNDFNPIEPIQFFGSPIRPYRFKENIDFHVEGNYIDTLMPPYGNNLLQVIKHHGDFRKLIGELIYNFGLELNIDSSNQEVLIQKKTNPGIVYGMKYESLADTLRRIIFFIAAVRYNSRLVITLEEPDAHSFPKYVSLLADEIIANNQTQVFIATHNPYLLNNLIENSASKELSVFVCGYDKEKGTTANKLSESDLSELLDFGVDIFFNINRYLDDGVKHSS